MAVQSLREILIKGLYDEDFLNRWLKDPASAVKGYDLTPAERNAVVERNVPAMMEMMRIGVAGEDVIVIVVAIVIVIVVVVGAVVGIQRQLGATAEVARGMRDAIRRATGAERYGHILELLSALSSEPKAG
jgi:hypothetical protein